MITKVILKATKYYVVKLIILCVVFGVPEQSVSRHTHTMLIFLSFLALLGFTFSLPLQTSLRDDMAEIYNRVPKAQLHELVQKHLTSNEEFQRVVLYLQSDEWAELVQALAAEPTWKVFKSYLRDSGLDIQLALIKFRCYVKHLVVLDGVTKKGLKFSDFLDEVNSVLVKHEVHEVIHEKLETSADFQEFYQKLSNENTRKFAEYVAELKEVQHMKWKLMNLGVDVIRVVDFFAELLGWKWT